jgi:hypothetical protein
MVDDIYHNPKWKCNISHMLAYGTWKFFMVFYIMLVFVNIDYVDIPIEKLSLIWLLKLILNENGKLYLWVWAK